MDIQEWIILLSSLMKKITEHMYTQGQLLSSKGAWQPGHNQQFKKGSMEKLHSGGHVC